MIPAAAGLACSDDVVDPLLSDHQALKDVGPCLCLLKFVRCTSLNHLLTVRHVNVEHVREGHEHRTPVDDGHHVRAVGFLQAA